MMKIISFIIAITLALCLAAVSAAYWYTELLGQERWTIALAVTASVCVSLMTPICAYNIRSHGYALIVPVLIFFVSDTYQNTQGWQTFKSLAVSEEVKAAKDRLATAQQALDAIPNPSATGEIRTRQTWLDTIATRKELRNDAKAELDAIQALETPLMYVAIIMGLIQIALSIFFACLCGSKETEPEQQIQEQRPAAHKQEPPVYDPDVISVMDKIAARANAS